MTDKVKVIIAVSVLIIAAGIFALTRGRDDVGFINDFYYKCTECGNVIDMSRQEVADEMTALRATYPEVTPFGMAVECPDCQKRSCRYSLKCGECGEVFVLDRSGEEPMKCPKCGTKATLGNN
jgi:DNA-directed RNA polymerase subunit RPC12/RpoP